jgi:hypothetical protein
VTAERAPVGFRNPSVPFRAPQQPILPGNAVGLHPNIATACRPRLLLASRKQMSGRTMSVGGLRGLRSRRPSSGLGRRGASEASKPRHPALWAIVDGTNGCWDPTRCKPFSQDASAGIGHRAKGDSPAGWNGNTRRRRWCPTNTPATVVPQPVRSRGASSWRRRVRPPGARGPFWADAGICPIGTPGGPKGRQQWPNRVWEPNCIP